MTAAFRKQNQDPGISRRLLVGLFFWFPRRLTMRRHLTTVAEAPAEEESEDSFLMSQLESAAEASFTSRKELWVQLHMDDDASSTVDEDCTCDTATSSDIYTDHSEQFDAIIELLSHENRDENKTGLQLLMEMVETDGLVELDSPSVSEAAFAILFGGAPDSDEVQRLVGDFIHEQEEFRDSDDYWSDDQSVRSMPDNLDDTVLYYSDDDSLENHDIENLVRKGKHDGCFEVQALQLISRSLEQLLSAEEYSTMMIPLDFECCFWTRVVGALIDNLQNFDSTDAAVVEHSLTVLRLLHTLHPYVMKPVLQNLLLPFLTQAEQYAREHQLEAIESETKRLLNCPTSPCDDNGFEV